MAFNEETRCLVIDYLLPAKDTIPNKEIEKNHQWKEVSVKRFKKIYEDIIYSIVIRTLSEIFLYDYEKKCDTVCLNGISNERNPATGNYELKYILSVIVTREKIENLDLNFITPSECFKQLKGISSASLYDLQEVQPITYYKVSDNRFIESRDINLEDSPNLAEMDWEEFEHLVRKIFEWEFADNGGEVKVTQSCRDGGVDAIAFDPDPIRGGKIIIQAKRYTNAVGVSAVRDLYGTIINEGANKGILITTSNYGVDSYKFAKDKPITLLNGNHLLYLLKKHGYNARINLEEAKRNQRCK